MKKPTIIILTIVSSLVIVISAGAFIMRSLNMFISSFDACKKGRESLSLDTKIASDTDPNLYLIAKSNKILSRDFFSYANITDYDKCEASANVKLGFYYKSQGIKEEQIYEGNYNLNVVMARKNDLEYDFTEVLKKYVNNLKVQKFNNDSTFYISGFNLTGNYSQSYSSRETVPLKSIIATTKSQKWSRFDVIDSENNDKIMNILNLDVNTSFIAEHQQTPDDIVNVSDLDCQSKNCAMTAQFRIVSYDRNNSFYKKAIIEINLSDSEAIIVGGRVIV